MTDRLLHSHRAIPISRAIAHAGLISRPNPQVAIGLHSRGGSDSLELK